MSDIEQSVGRPSKKTPEILDEICIRIASGESLNRICDSKHIPHKSTVMRWLADDEDFATKYARARVEQSNTFVDMMWDKATEDPERNPVTGAIDPGSVSHIRNQVGTLQWLAEKLNPKKYGNKVDVTSDGEKVGLSIQIDLTK